MRYATFRRIGLRLFLASLAGAGALHLAACSSSSNPSTNNTADTGTPDAVVPQEASVEPDAGTDATTMTPDAGPDAAPDVGPTCTPVDSGTPDGASPEAGMALVLEYTCYKCHQTTALDAGGITLAGSDVPAGIGITGFPPNLTPDPATGLGCWTDQQIETAILHGIDNEGAMLCVMPQFYPKFLMADAGDPNALAADIVAFIRTLKPVSHQVPDTTDCPVVDGGTDAAMSGDAESSSDASAKDGGASDGAVSDAAGGG